MNENYLVITNGGALSEFIEWLPELKDNETFYCCLFGRSKYVKNLPHIRSDKAQLKRFTSNKQRLYNKIKQLEIPLGEYYQKDHKMPQEALCVYITINPRCFIKANRESCRKLLDLALQPYNGFNPHQEVMSEIQKAKSRSEFVTFDFDVDKKSFDILDIYHNIDFLNNQAISIIETRGGYHFVVRTSKVAERYTKTWYKGMTDLLNKYSDDKNNKGDIMLPIVGTYQGGFTPKFIIKDGLEQS